jgi:xanthine dehydrogenase iron-sulfur cluster and FAD-binding subunit A
MTAQLRHRYPGDGDLVTGQTLAMVGNLCRTTVTPNIFKAAMSATSERAADQTHGVHPELLYCPTKSAVELFLSVP